MHKPNGYTSKDDQVEKMEQDSRILGDRNPLSSVYTQRNRNSIKPNVRQQQQRRREFWEKDWSQHSDDPLSFSGLTSCLWMNNAQRQQSTLLKTMLEIMELHMAELQAMMTGDPPNPKRTFFPLLKAQLTLRINFFKLRGLQEPKHDFSDPKNWRNVVQIVRMSLAQRIRFMSFVHAVGWNIQSFAAASIARRASYGEVISTVHMQRRLSHAMVEGTQTFRIEVLFSAEIICREIWEATNHLQGALLMHNSSLHFIFNDWNSAQRAPEMFLLHAVIASARAGGRCGVDFKPGGKFNQSIFCTGNRDLIEQSLGGESEHQAGDRDQEDADSEMIMMELDRLIS